MKSQETDEFPWDEIDLYAPSHLGARWLHIPKDVHRIGLVPMRV